MCILLCVQSANVNTHWEPVLLCCGAGREIGGHWDSGLPYLYGALKMHWVPMGDPAKPLQGVQLLLDHINVMPLKVHVLYCKHWSVFIFLCQLL